MHFVCSFVHSKLFKEFGNTFPMRNETCGGRTSFAQAWRFTTLGDHEKSERKLPLQFAKSGPARIRTGDRTIMSR